METIRYQKFLGGISNPSRNVFKKDKMNSKKCNEKFTLTDLICLEYEEIYQIYVFYKW